MTLDARRAADRGRRVTVDADASGRPAARYGAGTEEVSTRCAGKRVWLTFVSAAQADAGSSAAQADAGTRTRAFPYSAGQGGQPGPGTEQQVQRRLTDGAHPGQGAADQGVEGAGHPTNLTQAVTESTELRSGPAIIRFSTSGSPGRANHQP
jgi:hypothetical protein